MPKNTAVPSDCRISAPAPVAIASGSTPKMKANEVIRIGRSRVRAAMTAASKRSLPCASPWRANSTIRMAFLAASPTSTTKPTWARMLMSMPRASRPLTAASRHIGTMRMTESGSAQLSYCAASTRKTKTTEAAKTSKPDAAGQLLLIGELGPFIAEAVGQALGREPLHRRDGVAGRIAGRPRCPAPRAAG